MAMTYHYLLVCICGQAIRRGSYNKGLTLAFQLFMWIFELFFSNSVLCLLYMSLNPSQLCYFK